jgi:uncharacterized surface protein with fasciclin (FAS1) repeats
MLQASHHVDWTVFVPVNEAMQQFYNNNSSPSSTSSSSSTLDLPYLQSFVLFHICNQDYYQNELPCHHGDDGNDSSMERQRRRNLIRMMTGGNTLLFCNESDDDQNNNNNNTPAGIMGLGNDVKSNFVQFDIGACNGVIHTLDQVLLDDNTSGNGL